jgi:hypothetical protein
MTAKCANPVCRVRFNHRTGGKFFRFHVEENASSNQAGDIVHYWLCPVCSKIFSLTSVKDNKVVLRLLEEEYSLEFTENELTTA